MRSAVRLNLRAKHKPTHSCGPTYAEEWKKKEGELYKGEACLLLRAWSEPGKRPAGAASHETFLKRDVAFVGPQCEKPSVKILAQRLRHPVGHVRPDGRPLAAAKGCPKNSPKGTGLVS